jgi:hypothetical protein
LCAHCSLSGLAAVTALLFGALGWATGERVLSWVAPPILILGAFIWIVRTPKEACRIATE